MEVIQVLAILIVVIIILGFATIPWFVFFDLKKERYKGGLEYAGMIFCALLIALELLGVAALILNLTGKG